ncbi:MAG: type I 3-dehydroquinate dehydratase [Clostridia bacterium]|nr:type I 3-dehydroquinate dehydratase [Clostridia bacterium]
MRKSFAKVQAPMLAGVVKEKTPETAISEILNYYQLGATGIDLHLSCLADEYKNVESIKRIVDASPLPILALNYNQSYEGPIYEADDEAKTELLLKGIEAGAAACDIQGYTFDLPSKTAFREEFLGLGYSFIKDSPKEVVVDEKIIARQTEFIDKVHSLGAEVLLSNHVGVFMTAEQLCDFAAFLEKRNPDIIKIVANADTEEELAEAFRAMLMLKKEIKTPVSYHCNGKFGKLTRVVNPVLGGFMCFCNRQYSRNTANAQPLITTAKAAIDNMKKVEGI